MQRINTRRRRPVPHSGHTHVGLAGCCPLHMATGCFAPNRQWATLGTPAAETISFSDITPKQRSQRCNDDRTATQDLYERMSPGQALMFRDARVLTMRDDTILDRHDVVVRGGRIESVRPTGQEVPEGAVIVEGAGKTLIPGLSDIHAHIFTVNWAKAFGSMVGSEDGSEYVLPYDLMLFLMLANGITKVEVMAGCPETLWMRDSVRDGTLVGPRLSVGSPLIDGAPAMHSPLMSYVVGDLEGGLRAGEMTADMGFDFAKPYTRLPADGYEGLMQACERRGIRVMGHVPEAVGIEKAVNRGQRGIAHCAELFYNEQGPERYDQARIERFVRLMADTGTWMQATLVVLERMGFRSGSGPLNAPDREWMNPIQSALWHEDSPMLAAIKSNTEYEHYFKDVYELGSSATRAAREAGVGVLTGTDFPNPYVVEGFSLHEELELLVSQAGFTPQEVLTASTRKAAIYHGEGQTDGTISEGGVADLVLLDGDPLAEISTTRKIEAVLARDALLRRSAIEKGLARVRSTYDAMPEAVVRLPQQHEYLKQDSADNA